MPCNQKETATLVCSRKWKSFLAVLKYVWLAIWEYPVLYFFHESKKQSCLLPLRSLLVDSVSMNQSDAGFLWVLWFFPSSKSTHALVDCLCAVWAVVLFSAGQLLLSCGYQSFFLSSVTWSGYFSIWSSWHQHPSSALHSSQMPLLFCDNKESSSLSSSS